MTPLSAHEKECAIRFENIDKRFDSGSKRFDKLEYLIYGQYGLIVTAMIGLFIDKLFN